MIAFAVGLLALLLAPAATAEERPGRFDYWVLSLSWSPQHCKSNLSDDQCKEPHAFIVHGLWPQYERGYPDYCDREEKRVSDDLEDRMLPVMPSKGLIQYQWRKHGSCSGLDAYTYFLQTERAYRGIAIPPEYQNPEDPIETSVGEIEERFIALNPKLLRESIALQCSGKYLKEVRVCLAKDFQPRACGDDVQDECRSTVVFRPLRRPVR